MRRLLRCHTRTADSAIPSSEDRVRKGAEKLAKFLNAKQQGRLDGFFAAKPKEAPAKGKDDAKGKGKGTKRKVRSSPLRKNCVDSNMSRRRTTRRRRAPGRARRRRQRSRQHVCIGPFVCYVKLFVSAWTYPLSLCYWSCYVLLVSSAVSLEWNPRNPLVSPYQPKHTDRVIYAAV